MSAVQHPHWEGFNHPYKMLEKHYCEGSWNLVKNNEVSVWGSFEPVPISEIIDWNIDPFDNDTWSFYFNGLNWLYSYIWAVDNLGEKPDRIFDIILQYEKHINGENPNKMVWFDHATSDRLCIFTAISLHPCISHASLEFQSIMERLIIQHVTKIIQFKDSRNWINSNHGIFHALALLNASILQSVSSGIPDVKQNALEYLSDTLLSILSINEFFSLEQSAYYHQLAISLLNSLDKKHLDAIGIQKESFIQKMKEVNYWLTSTDKKLIAIGDTSVVSNVENKYLTGYSHNKMASTFKETGFSVVKYISEGGWNNFSFLHHSERAPHGHFDALSITLSKGNKEFIIDSGGPYRYGNSLRFRYFMSSYAHNVAIINGKTHELGAQLVQSHSPSENIFVVEAEHEGYYPITHNRKCVYVKNKGLIVFDSFSNIESTTNIQLLWHMHPDCDFSDDYSEVSNAGSCIWIRNNMNTEKEVVSGIEGEFPQGWVTPGIGLKEPCPTLIDSIDIEEDTVIVTYFEYEKNCLQDFSDLQEKTQRIDKDDSEPVVPFGFNESTIEKYLSKDPIFWQPGTYFGDRNIWKINKSQQKLSSLKLTNKEKSIKIKENIARRFDLKTPTIYIVSNGGSGCHYLGGLMSMKKGFKLIDEVYFPPIITNSIELEEINSTGLIEMVNVVHLAEIDSPELIPINTMHLRKDTPLTKLMENSVNSKFIFLIRNPIDIAISRGLRKLDYKMQNKENIGLSDNEYLQKQANFTKNHFNRLFSKENEVDALKIKYEDLIENPGNTLNNIFKFIETELREDEIDEILVEYSSARDITKNENRKAKPELTESQKEILISELSDTCSTLGYDIPKYVGS